MYMIFIYKYIYIFKSVRVCTQKDFLTRNIAQIRKSTPNALLVYYNIYIYYVVRLMGIMVNYDNNNILLRI